MCRPIDIQNRIPMSNIYTKYFLPRSLFQFIINPFETKLSEIQKEFFSYFNKENSQLFDETAGLSSHKQWKYLLLSKNGQLNQNICKYFPVTCQVIDSIPETKLKRGGQVKFSVLSGESWIKPHCGASDFKLRMHCTIQSNSKSAIRVGNQIKSWEENECFVFDETCEHEVWNNSTSTRVVLIVDFLNPLVYEFKEYLMGLREADRVNERLKIHFDEVMHGLVIMDTGNPGPSEL